MISDLVIASRGLWRNPAFTVAAVATLALGIGANTTMFSVVNSVLLRPLPGYETGRLVQICDDGRGDCRFLAPELFQILRKQSRSFETLAANQNCRFNLTGGGEAEQLDTPCATANWFELHRAQAMLGRTFLPDEDQHGRNRVAVLDHGFWQRRFGADRNIIGRTLTLDNEPWVVIGVMAAGFTPAGAAPSPIYTPYVIDDNPHGVNVTGRLRPGVSLETARAELKVLSRVLPGQHPEWNPLKLSAAPLIERLTGPQRPLLLLLLGAVAFVLLIACVNAANLLLARSKARQHEIAVRIALGARRAHIVRFVLGEALAISLAASAAAVAIAYAGVNLLRPLTASLPRSDEIRIDVRVLLFALIAGVFTALLFGMLPAVRSSRSAVTLRSQRSLLAAQVALAFVLLTGAGLLIRTFVAIRTADLGYDPSNVLTHFIALPPSPDGSRTAGAALFERVRGRVAALPGVTDVATASRLPMFGVSVTMDVQPEGQPHRRNEHQAALSVISEGYFRAMRIPLRAGRTFSRDDRGTTTPVAIVSESVAARYFGGKVAGKRIILPEVQFNIDGGKDIAATIVGVVGDVCVNSVEHCRNEHIYLPERQAALRMENLIVRAGGDPMALARSVRRAVQAEAPSIPLDEAQTLEQRTSYLTDGPKRAMWLLSVFAGLALLIASAGIYGVSCYLAVERRREIGIRMALGARFTDIAGLVFRGVLLPSGAGLAIGAACALGLAQLLKSVLSEVHSLDPVTMIAAGLALLGVSGLAAAGPAVRAGLTNPAKVLRRE